MARQAGIPNRNYPPLTLTDALRVPQVIQDEAGGMEVSRLTLADLLGTTPGSSVFRELVASSRFYGLTTGGINSDEFSTTGLGERATSDDEEIRVPAFKEAVMRVEPFKAYFDAFAGKKMPGAIPAREFLIRSAGVPEAHAQDAIDHILADAEMASFVRDLRGARYIDLAGTPVIAPPTDEEGDVVEGDDVQEPHADPEAEEPEYDGNGHKEHVPEEPERPSAIFVGGRKGKSLDQLTKVLDEYKIPYKLAEAEPNRGHPISQKVADTMKDCGAAILVFTPDEELRDLEGNPIWRPTENLVHELGAASMLYGNRIVIFREETVTLASNYSDIGHITFRKDELDAKAIELFRELIAFGLVRVTVGAV